MLCPFDCEQCINVDCYSEGCQRVRELALDVCHDCGEVFAMRWISICSRCCLDTNEAKLDKTTMER